MDDDAEEVWALGDSGVRVALDCRIYGTAPTRGVQGGRRTMCQELLGTCVSTGFATRGAWAYGTRSQVDL